MLKQVIIGTVTSCLIYVVFCQIDCSNRRDGTYGKGCKSYTYCKDGNGYQVDCRGDLVYNPNKDDCDRKENTPPPCGSEVDCSNLRDGRYPNLNDSCRSFFTCENGKSRGINPCVDGLVFDVEYGNCNRPEDVYPPCGTLTLGLSTPAPTTDSN